MSFIGNIALGQTFSTKFCTVQTTGAPFTLAGSPVISAYPANSTTQLTAGITLTVDFDSVTGLANVTVVATTGNGYLTATDYQLVITTGTVNSVSVVGYVIGEFSIENRPANVTFWNGTAVATPDTAGYPKVTIKDGTGTGEIDTIAGAVAHVVLTDTTTTVTNATTVANSGWKVP